MDAIHFLVYGFGCIIAPRVTLAVVVLDLASGSWALGLATWCFVNAFGNYDKLRQRMVYVANAANRAITGRQLIVERVVEKIVEKTVTVEKIVERVRTVKVKVRVNELSTSDAYAVLRCLPSAGRAELMTGYREMIKRVHPDKGGSVYLASIVNQAKTMLLK